MRIINISLVLIFVLKPSFQMAIVKGHGSFSENVQDCSKSGETPEATNVHETDVAKPQLPEDLKGPTSFSPITPKMKRCARSRLGSSNPTLSLARRDVTDFRTRQCEICKNGRICKELKRCTHCRTFCNSTDFDNNNIQTEQIQSPVTTEAQEMIVGSRFKETEENPNRPIYYSLGSVDPGTLMELFSKIFNIPDNFEKLIILGKMKGSKSEGEDGDNIVIIDLAQAFRNEKKVVARVQRVSANKDLVEKLNEDLDRAIINKLAKTGNTQLNTDELQGLVDNAIEENNVGNVREATTNSPETETRCNVDEAVEDLLNIMPNQQQYPVHTYPEHKPESTRPEEESLEEFEEPHPDYTYPKHKPAPTVEKESSEEYAKPLKPLLEESSEEFGNPPVIQDNYKEAKSSQKNLVGKNLEEGFIDDNEEAKPEVSDAKVPKTLSRLQETANEVIPKETEVLKESPQSDNQIKEPLLEDQNPEENLVDNSLKMVPNEAGSSGSLSSLQDLEKNVVRIVEDSLKAVPDGQNFVPRENLVGSTDAQVPEENFVPRENLLGSTDPQVPEENFVTGPQLKIPSEDLTKNVFKVVEDSLKLAEVPPEENLVEAEAPLEFAQANSENIATEQEITPPKVGNRAQIDSSEEESTYFGALVPAKNTPPNLDPRIKNLLYIGDNINLPLKMFQDENGIMKLRVDTDALCNCKNKNCTKKHVDDTRLRQNENEENNTVLPELQVRFGRESHNDEDLMNSFVDDLRKNGENSEIFKRSPVETQEESEKLELENEIEKLSESIEKYDKENEFLLNKGTMALYENVEKTKNVDKMVSLASNLLSWMKDVATEKLRS